MDDPNLTPGQQAMMKTLQEHAQAEAVDRDLDATLATMTDNPHIFISQTLAGAEGRDGVREFYTCLMTQIPKDLTFTPITRTISTNRIVTEYVVSFTHDVTIDWLLPRIPPTGKQVEIPVIVICTFKGDKLDSEHLYWDQASLLMQIGVLQSDSLPITSQSARRLLELSARS